MDSIYRGIDRQDWINSWNNKKINFILWVDVSINFRGAAKKRWIIKFKKRMSQTVGDTGIQEHEIPVMT